jgi:energy-coupling factor transport system ATP-binding protein
MKPEVLVLDEPAAGLDPAGRNDIFELIRSYNENTGCTVIIVSHSMEDMAKYAEKIIVMNKAKLYCHDYTEKVFSYADEIAKEYNVSSEELDDGVEWYDEYHDDVVSEFCLLLN